VAAVTGLTLVKKFNYRSDTSEEFSNTYHFKDLPPGDDASWQVLMYDVLNEEKTVLNGGTTYTRAYGYNSDDPKASAVFSHDFVAAGSPPVGIFPGGSGHLMAGDQAGCVEWRLDRKNTRGKWIYLRKYFHGGLVSNTSPDSLEAIWVTALSNFASVMHGTGMHGGIRPRAYDANITATEVIPWVTTRTLKRRGKRPRVAS